MNHFDDFEIAEKHKRILRLLLSDNFHVNEIKRRVDFSAGVVIKAIQELQEEGFIEYKALKNKKIYYLTDKGKQVTSLFKIKEEYGHIGEKWAEDKHNEGYNVRFLSDLTGDSRHQNWIFAWHPFTKDIDLVRNMGFRSLKDNGSFYRAQYVDRSVDKDKPIRDAELFSYISESLGDKWDEESLSQVLKDFWSLENHNSFVCLLAPPDESDFAFPSDIGRQALMTFIGLGHQLEFPFIPKLSVFSGGFNMSDNLKANFIYESDLMAARKFCKIFLQNMVFPDSVSEEDVMKLFRNSFTSPFAPVLRATCVNICEDGVTCRKMGVKCMALLDNMIDFSKCHILQNDPLFS